jgi:hypothetical protein
MARFAKLLFFGDFATGVTYYEDLYSDEAQVARMVLPVFIEDYLVVPAIVDTGAPWCVIDPDTVREVGTSDIEYQPDQLLMVRGRQYKGKLIGMQISLESEQGESVDVDATVFVPLLLPGETWPHPNFIGLDGFLNRIRFAVDPEENAFYFGPI